MRNIKKIKTKEADEWFLRNYKSLKNDELNFKMISLIKNNNISSKSILEIGCANGVKLNQYSNILKTKINYGVDLSKKAILDGGKKYKNLNLLNISSLEIDKIKTNFDLIICGFFLYHLDRELIFSQFDLIYNKLNKNGLLLINDFDPLFKHSNKDFNTKNLISYKMSYDNFLIESGLFEMIYKIKYDIVTKDNRKFKSDKISLTLFKKIDFKKKYPEDL